MATKTATETAVRVKAMRLSRLFFRGVCILCGVLGFGIFILAATHGGWLVWLGVACLLIGLVAASFVTRKW
jgi:hypothetical protein